MLTLRDLCIHAYFRSINLNGINDPKAKMNFARFCKISRCATLPLNIFIRILTNDSRMLTRQLPGPYFFSYLGGTTHLDLRDFTKSNVKTFTTDQIPTLFKLMYESFGDNERKPLQVLRLPYYGNPIPWEEIEKIITDHPHLELLELPVWIPKELHILAEIAISTNIKRKKLKLPSLSFQTSSILAVSDSREFSAILNTLQEARIPPESFQITVKLSYNVHIEGVDTFKFYQFDQICNSPYISKFIDLESVLEAVTQYLSPEQKSKIIFEYSKTILESTELHSLLTQIKKSRENNRIKNTNAENHLLAQESSTVALTKQLSEDFFRMTYISKLTMESTSQEYPLNLTQAELDTILSLNLDILNLTNLANIEMVRSTTVTTLTCSNCSQLEYIQLPYANRCVEVEDCPMLIQILAPCVVLLSVNNCEKITEFSNSSVASVSFHLCNSLTRVDTPGAFVCELYSCQNLEAVFIRTSYLFSAHMLPSLREIHAPNAKVINLFGCDSLKRLIAPSASELMIRSCDVLEFLDAPLYKGIRKSSISTTPNIKIETKQELILPPNIRHLYLPSFKGILAYEPERQFTYYNAPHAVIKMLPPSTTDVIKRRPPYKSATIHLVAIAMLGILGLLYFHLMKAQNDPQE